jgi:hypothetical protein
MGSKLLHTYTLFYLHIFLFAAYNILIYINLRVELVLLARALPIYWSGVMLQSMSNIK